MKRSFVLVALVAISGCAITSREATTDLPGTAWELVELDGDEVVGDVAPTLTFGDGGGVSGTTGCNTFNGEVAIDGSELTFGPLATTRMACVDEALSAQEQAYLVGLEAVSGYTIDDEGRLVLEGGGTTLTFEVAAQAE